MNDRTRKRTKIQKNSKVFESIKHNPLILEFSNFPLFPPIFSFGKKRKKKQTKQNKNEIKKKRTKALPRNDSISWKIYFVRKMNCSRWTISDARVTKEEAANESFFARWISWIVIEGTSRTKRISGHNAQYNSWIYLQ